MKSFDLKRQGPSQVRIRSLPVNLIKKNGENTDRLKTSICHTVIHTLKIKDPSPLNKILPISLSSH